MFENAGKHWEAYLPTVLAHGEEGWLVVQPTQTEQPCSICKCDNRTYKATYCVATVTDTLVRYPINVCTECVDALECGFGEGE